MKDERRSGQHGVVVATGWTTYFSFGGGITRWGAQLLGTVLVEVRVYLEDVYDKEIWLSL